ncbi:MAG: NYN domain-containing protein [Longimicrobiales bacterium]|nr:NYN domain-containing protein [Longimicrobiales bacterium]
MNVPYTRAPHQGIGGHSGHDATHAALLIDFDNVTLGMRSELSKELKSLLDSDVIKGKVSVQRAYADWRRYPQYIVPLSEASVDLIFAPAYGSNKKNATDIRMAIDALELVFIRPEIGTYILLTGDADFSSLVLKLKEYGKYVIGVGIQESSSDILVQNCDEYYSYTSLTGLTKTTELNNREGRDPWLLAKDAVAKMVQRGDVMRSDRLKQVMQELDPTFDEGAIGFSKFSKFLAEGSSRGVVNLRKLENGQYEVEPGKSSSSDRPEEGRSRASRSRGGRSRGGRGRGSRSDRGQERTDSVGATETSSSPEDVDPLRAAYDVLSQALSTLREAGRDPVRDSDVKRKILERDRSFDETELGFAKFSKFLEQALQDGVVTLTKTEAGNHDVSLAEGVTADSPTSGVAAPAVETQAPVTTTAVESPAEVAAPAAPPKSEEKETKRGLFGFLGARRGSTSRRGGKDGSSLFGLGNIVSSSSGEPTPKRFADDRPSNPRSGGTGVAATEMNEPDESGETDYDEPDLRIDSAVVDYGDNDEEPDEVVAAPPTRSSGPRKSGSATSSQSPAVSAAPTSESPAVSSTQEAPSGSAPSESVEGLGLPSDPGAIVRYLTHRYKGVGEKTAETLVETLGADIFRTMQEDPDRIGTIVPPGRAEQVLEAWKSDFERRSGAKTSGSSGSESGTGGRSGGGRGRGRGRS